MVARYAKLTAYIILLIAFFYFFGYDNILRYLRGGITVVKYDKKTDGIPPPGIVLSWVLSMLMQNLMLSS